MIHTTSVVVMLYILVVIFHKSMSVAQGEIYLERTSALTAIVVWFGAGLPTRLSTPRTNQINSVHACPPVFPLFPPTAGLDYNSVAVILGPPLAEFLRYPTYPIFRDVWCFVFREVVIIIVTIKSKITPPWPSERLRDSLKWITRMEGGSVHDRIG